VRWYAVQWRSGIDGAWQTRIVPAATTVLDAVTADQAVVRAIDAVGNASPATTATR
jgi:hypothetical protein